jgi:hypothetical protein
MSTVATNGKFPAVSAIGQTVICSFVRNGDIYAAKSQDGGVTWDEFSALNEESGSVIEQECSIDIAGSYVVWTDSRDNNNRKIYYSAVGNPPNKPSKPSGPTSGGINTEYTYSTSADDPDGDEIYYVFDWGDDTEDVAGPYSSGETGRASHKWSTRGNYNIKVKARDSSGFESEWSDPLSISMPKGKSYAYRPFLRALLILLDRFQLTPRLLTLI